MNEQLMGLNINKTLGYPSPHQDDFDSHRSMAMESLTRGTDHELSLAVASAHVVLELVAFPIEELAGVRV